MRHLLILAIISILSFSYRATAIEKDPGELCIYPGKDGKVVQVQSVQNVPPDLRSIARCFPAGQNQFLAAPEDVTLSGTIRKEGINSPIGRIEARWPRKVELLFGRTPMRALIDAANTVSRALKRGGFPSSVETFNTDWKIVFLDEDLPETQIPGYLVTNCHPAWMTPPGNVYVVSQRVAAGCGDVQRKERSVADAELARVLIHEIGHGLEYAILQDQFSADRPRAEGFAAWFEQYSSDLSSVIPSGSIERYYLGLARNSFLASPDHFNFSGRAEDYARASLYFKAIQRKRGVAGIMEIYSTMVSNKIDFLSALKYRMNWSDIKLREEIKGVLDSFKS